MLKVIEMGSKLNVVDSDNNFVGFDLSDDCCAHGGYFIADKEITKDFDEAPAINKVDFPEYEFDLDYFKDHDPKNDKNYDYTEENVVIFKLSPIYGHDELPPLYLHLFNVHNGYYSKSYVSLMGYHHTVHAGSI